jgi:glycosyltransferase involved in cell wall biosynthesis
MRAADAFFFTAVRDADPWRQAGFIASRQPVHPVLESSTTIRPVDRFTAREDTRLEGDPALLWVGRLNENKDPLTILDGYEAALSRLPGAMLTLIYGTGDLLPGVTRRLQASARLAGRVRLRGAVPHEHMASFYSAADLFVLGSHHEGSGYALLEACACGLPPVVTDIPTFRSMTDEGSIGALWPPGEPSAFADALVEVAGRDGRALRRQVLGHFERALSWTAVARQAADAYAAVLTSVGAGRHV